jgi:ArsR family transcriptional regulator
MRMQKKPPRSLDTSAAVFKAFADPVRLRLLNLLSGREVCVCHLHEALELPQSTVSRHLAYLRKAGLVVGKKQGLWVHYRLSEAPSDLQRLLVGCLGTCFADEKVTQDDRRRLEKLKCC